MQVLADEDQPDRDAALGLALERADDDADVVIRPLRDEARGMTTWLLSRTGAPQGRTIAKLRVTRKVPARLRVHPGRDWFTVLSGAIVLRLGKRTILVRPARRPSSPRWSHMRSAFRREPRRYCAFSTTTAPAPANDPA